MKNNPAIIKALRGILFAVVCMNIASCNRDRNHPGWDYFPDMFYSTAYETNSPNPNFKDGMTMRVPVQGTVSRESVPFAYTNDPESRIKAGKELVNPFTSSEENIARGKYVYTTFCLGCHGSRADGNGRLYTSGLYTLKPLNLSGTSGRNLKDGEIFHTITLGIRSMGAHGSQILPDDRWKLVLYIRTLQSEGNNDTVTKK